VKAIARPCAGRKGPCFVTLASLLLALLALPACVPYQRDHGDLEVVGTVYDAATKKPIAGATVTVEHIWNDERGGAERPEDWEPARATTKADHNGHFALVIAQPGSGDYLAVFFNGGASDYSGPEQPVTIRLRAESTGRVYSRQIPLWKESPGVRGTPWLNWSHDRYTKLRVRAYLGEPWPY
jgi:hypothetical protein